MNSDDEKFVFSSWFRSAGVFYKGVESAQYVPGMTARIYRLMRDAEVLVAFPTVAPTEILGYVVLEGAVLHYAYVKPAYRRQGVARALAVGRATQYSVPAKEDARKFVESLQLKYNPFALER